MRYNPLCAARQTSFPFSALNCRLKLLLALRRTRLAEISHYSVFCRNSLKHDDGHASRLISASHVNELLCVHLPFFFSNRLYALPTSNFLDDTTQIVLHGRLQWTKEFSLSPTADTTNLSIVFSSVRNEVKLAIDKRYYLIFAVRRIFNRICHCPPPRKTPTDIPFGTYVVVCRNILATYSNKSCYFDIVTILFSISRSFAVR